MSKKAWQIELETMQNSIPVVLKDEEQGWNYAETLEMVEDAAVAMKWHSNVPGSHAEEHVIIGAMQDMENPGIRDSSLCGFWIFCVPCKDY